jgi:hypothetical protein
MGSGAAGSAWGYRHSSPRALKHKEAALPRGAGGGHFSTAAGQLPFYNCDRRCWALGSSCRALIQNVSLRTAFADWPEIIYSQVKFSAFLSLSEARSNGGGSGGNAARVKFLKPPLAAFFGPALAIGVEAFFFCQFLCHLNSKHLSHLHHGKTMDPLDFHAKYSRLERKHRRVEKELADHWGEG